MEFEIKLAATPDVFSRIAADPALGICGDAAELPMETTYFDTPDGSLSAKKWMLRRRLEGGVSVVTMKTPGEGRYQRGEWELPAGEPLAAIPALISRGAPAALAAVTALVPVCGAKFLRRAYPLQLCGCRAELAMDQGTLFRGERSIPLCEVELECKDGDPAALVALAGHLRRAYGLTEEPRSKFARARSL